MSLALDVFHLSATLGWLLGKFCDEHELSQTQALVLVLLASPPAWTASGWVDEAATPSAIRRKIGGQQAAVAMQLANLRRRYLIELVDAPADKLARQGLDGRARLYRLTSAGRALARDARSAVAHLDEALRVMLAAKGCGEASRLLCDALSGFERIGDPHYLFNLPWRAREIARERRRSSSRQARTRR